MSASHGDTAPTQLPPQQWHHTTLGDKKDGPTFVWLHGWGQTHSSLMRLAGLFKDAGYHLLFDQPGFGATPQLPDRDGTPAGTADYADTLAHILDSYENCIFIGHSFGVRVAVQMAARHPEKVATIIGIGGAGLKRNRSFGEKIRAFYLRQLGKAARLADQLFGTHFREAYSTRFGSGGYRNAGALRGTFVRVVNEDLIAEAKAITCPTCLIYGANDTEAPPEIGKKYNSLIQDSRYHELPGFDHWDILERGAYQCQALMQSFLEEKGKR